MVENSRVDAPSDTGETKILDSKLGQPRWSLERAVYRVRSAMLVLAAVFLAVAWPAADAASRSGGTRHWSGSGTRSAHPHSHRGHRPYFRGAFIVGAPLYWPYAYYGHPPYYYAPDYVARAEPPTVYIERFDGTPTAQSGEIFCPSQNANYPQVEDCPGGWQRIIRPGSSAP
jgi:hypothetical protein